MDILSDLLSNRSVVFSANLFVPLQFIRNWSSCLKTWLYVKTICCTLCLNVGAGHFILCEYTFTMICKTNLSSYPDQAKPSVILQAYPVWFYMLLLPLGCRSSLQQCQQKPCSFLCITQYQ